MTRCSQMRCGQPLLLHLRDVCQQFLNCLLASFCLVSFCSHFHSLALCPKSGGHTGGYTCSPEVRQVPRPEELPHITLGPPGEPASGLRTRVCF